MCTNFGGVELESSRAFFEDDDEDEHDSVAAVARNGLRKIEPSRAIQDEYFESRIVQDGRSYKLYILDDDELNSEEDISNSGLNTEVYVEEAFETFLEKNRGKTLNLFCIFSSRIPVGFGKGYLSQARVSLAKIFYTGSQGTVDSLLKRAKSKLVAEIVKAGENLIFALIDTYAVPTVTINDICAEHVRNGPTVQFLMGSRNPEFGEIIAWLYGETITNMLLEVFIEASHHVVIFHSEGIANFKSERDNFTESKMFYIRNEFYHKIEIPLSVTRCPYPNLLSGISATILALCQQDHKPCLVLVNFTPTEIVSQITLKPFFSAVQERQPSYKDLDISVYFSALEFNLGSTGSSIPSYISQSNLYT